MDNTESLNSTGTTPQTSTQNPQNIGGNNLIPANGNLQGNSSPAANNLYAAPATQAIVVPSTTPATAKVATPSPKNNHNAVFIGVGVVVILVVAVCLVTVLRSKRRVS